MSVTNKVAAQIHRSGVLQGSMGGSASSPRAVSLRAASFSIDDNMMQPKESKKQRIWVEPLSKNALTAAVEAGCTSFVFRDRKQADEWSSLAMFTPMYVQDESLVTANSQTIARWANIASVEEQQQVMKLAGQERIVVLDAADWKIIPAENLIAAFQVWKRSALPRVFSSYISCLQVCVFIRLFCVCMFGKDLKYPT
jgi:hypothetical protein